MTDSALWDGFFRFERHQFGLGDSPAECNEFREFWDGLTIWERMDFSDELREVREEWRKNGCRLF